MRKVYRIDVYIPNHGYSLAVSFDGNEKDVIEAALNANLFECYDDKDIATATDITNDEYERSIWDSLTIHEL